MTLWTVARQAPLPMGFSREEYWSGLPCLPPGDLPDPGIEPASLMSPAGEFFTTAPPQIILLHRLGSMDGPALILWSESLAISQMETFLGEGQLGWLVAQEPRPALLSPWGAWLSSNRIHLTNPFQLLQSLVCFKEATLGLILELKDFSLCFLVSYLGLLVCAVSRQEPL